MSKSKITKTIDYLSQPRHGITAAVLLVLFIVAVVFVWRKIKGLWSGSPVKILGDAAIEAGTGTTISPSIDFAHLVVRLLEATYRLGTDEDEVYSVLECLNTQADYMKLCKSWISSYSNWGFFVRSGVKATLPAQLQSELSSSELAKARNILIDKGITPDF